MSDPSFYSIETTLNPRRDCYVERPADKELVKVLLARKYSFILSSRKVGKSSLIQHSFLSLRQRGVLVASYELPIGVEEGTNEEQWYFGIAVGLVLDAKNHSEFTVDPGWSSWWEKNLRLPPMQRLIHLLREFFLAKTGDPWVIAIDEIDTTLPLRFSDDFFAGIRWCYNARASDPLFERLTFLLVGVASPTHLIKNRQRTPFNLGTRVEIADFTADQARKLLRGLELPEEKDHPTLQQVLHWTDGHPYLTQRLFFEIASELDGEIPPDSANEWRKLVDRVVEKTFFKPGIFVTEAHFQNIAESRIESFRPRGQLMTIYRRALRGETVKDDPLSPAKSELKLSGLLKTDPRAPDRLNVRNRIYERVFNEHWIRENTPIRWARGVAIAASFGVLFAIGTLMYQQRQVESARVADLIAQLENAGQDVPTRAYDELAARPAQKSVADEKMAAYWERQALRAEQIGTRDEAIVLWLKSRIYHDSPARQLAIRVALEVPASEIAVTFRHDDSVDNASFSADGTKIVTASRDTTARVWDATTGRPLSAPLRHEGPVYSATFSEDATKVVTSSTGAAQVWDAATGKPLGEPLRHKNSVWSANFSEDGTKVVTASSDQTAQVWDAAAGKPLGEPLRHKNSVWRAHFSHDGTKVVTASADNTAQVWDVTTGKPLVTLLHKDNVWRANFSHDGTKVVTASSDQTAQVWDATTGKRLSEPLRHEQAVFTASFNADATMVVTASEDNTARVWDATTGRPLSPSLRHEGRLYLASFCVDATKVITASSDNSARVWDAATGAPLGAPLLHDGPVWDASFGSDATKVITASRDKTARVWDISTDSPHGQPLRHQDSVNNASFSSDATKIATASKDKTARVWNVASGNPLSANLRHQDSVNSASFSSDATKVVTASRDGTARLWDATTGRQLGEPLRHENAVNGASFSADATKVVTASRDGTARVWDAATCRQLGEPLRHQGSVNSASFSTDGTKIVTASTDRTVRLWDAATGNPLDEPLGHEDTVYSASFSADTTQIVTASEDKTARVWDTLSRRQLGEPLRHEGPVLEASFTANGRCIITRTLGCIRWWERKDADNTFRLAGIRWTRGIQWKPNLQSNHDGARVYVTEAITGDAIVVRKIGLGLHDPVLPILTESPAELLAAWQRRLALKFEDETRSPDLIPAYSSPSLREADRPSPSAKLQR